jgi:hypothetical protein
MLREIMRVSYEAGWDSSRTIIPLEDYIAKKLDYDGYSEDQLRGMSYRTENVAGMVARLITLLVDKKVISNEDEIFQVLGIGGYEKNKVDLLD